MASTSSKNKDSLNNSNDEMKEASIVVNQIDSDEIDIVVQGKDSDTVGDGSDGKEVNENDNAEGNSAFTYFTVRTYNEVIDLIQKHGQDTGTSYCVSRRTKHFGKHVNEIDYKNHTITWDHRNITISDFRHPLLQFDGTPYMIVGHYYMACEFGQDSQQAKKEKYKKMKENGEIVVSRERPLSCKTKKCGCPARLHVKQVVKFPEYKLKQISKSRKTSVNRKLRECLNNHGKVEMESYFIGRLPDIEQHKFHDLLKFDMKTKEAIHKDLKILAQNLGLQGKKISEIQTNLKTLVIDDWFHRKTPPDLSHRKYFPKGADLRNMCNTIHRLCEFTDNDVDSLSQVTQSLQSNDTHANIGFHMDNIDENQVQQGDDFFDNDGFFREQRSPTPVKKKKYIRKTKPSPPKQYKSFVFFFQSSLQQKLVMKYGNTCYITQLQHDESSVRALTFKMYLLLVQTNVDFQVVGCLAHSKLKDAVSLYDCLQHVKDLNPTWAPKYFVGDCCKKMAEATEKVFPDSEYFFNPIACHKEWLRFIETPQHELTSYTDEIIQYLRSMENSHTTEALTSSASLMEISDVWNRNQKLREWFQTEWLLTAKQWVKAYRPEDLLIMNHGHESFKETVCRYARAMSESTHTTGQTGFIKLVECIGKEISVAIYDRYKKMNENLIRNCKQMSFSKSDLQYSFGLPLRLLPIYMQIKDQLDSTKFRISSQHFGIFQVYVEDEDDEEARDNVVVFGSNDNFPSCTCSKWHEQFLPCLHMFAIFKHEENWKYDSLGLCYRMNPMLTIDYSCTDHSNFEIPSSNDISCQTAPPTPPPQQTISIPQRVQQDSFLKTIFKSSSNVECPDSMLIKLKNFRSELKDIVHLFSDKKYQRVLETDLHSLINGLEMRKQFVPMGSLLKKDAVTTVKVDKSKIIDLRKQKTKEMT